MMDDIIIIFEMTLQLMVSRETFDIKDSSEYARHSDRFDVKQRNGGKEG